MAFTHPTDAQFQAEIDAALTLVNDVRIACGYAPVFSFLPGTRGTHAGCPVWHCLRDCGVAEVHADFAVVIGERTAEYLAHVLGTESRHRYDDRYEVTLPEALRVFGERFNAGFYDHLELRAGQAAA